MRQWSGSLFQVMNPLLFSVKPLPEPMLHFCFLSASPLGTTPGNEIWMKIWFSFMKMSLLNVSHCVPALFSPLTHWGWVTHICVSRITVIGSDNGLSPGRRIAIIWTNAGILLIGPLGTNFSEIFLLEIYTFSFTKMHLKMLSGKSRPFCLGLNVLTELIGNGLVRWFVTLSHFHAKFPMPCIRCRTSWP